MTLVEFLIARVDDDSAGARSDRMRAEVKAKRRLIDLHTFRSGGVRAPYGPDHEHPLQVLAEIYSDHPDYRPEWAV